MIGICKRCKRECRYLDVKHKLCSSCYAYLREKKTGYRQRPEVKKRINESSRKWKKNNPEKVRKYAREFAKRPHIRKKRKEYDNKPEVKKKKKEYDQKYHQRPEIIKREKKYRKEHYNKPEIKKQRNEYRKKWYGKKGKKYMREYMRKRNKTKSENYKIKDEN